MHTAICMLTNPKLDGAWLQLISYYLILKVQGGGVQQMHDYLRDSADILNKNEDTTPSISTLRTNYNLILNLFQFILLL